MMQGTKCLELRICSPDMDEERFAGLAAAAQALGTAEETDADSGIVTFIAWFDAEADEMQQRAQLTAAALLAGATPEAITLSELGNDWETAWQKNWHAMPVGKRLWIRPSFCEEAPADRIDIVLDPGMAFGTGQHATTRLCLEAIERICDEQKITSVLDMGAGSGLLAIAAGKLGASNILAIDNDPLAVEACDTNAAINTVELASRLDDTPPAGPFELVVANILAGPLIEMAPKLAAASGRNLVLSGLLTTQIDDVRHAYEAAGMHYLRHDCEGEWASLEFTP